MGSAYSPRSSIVKRSHRRVAGGRKAQTNGPRKVYALRFADAADPSDADEARRNREFRAYLDRSDAWVKKVPPEATVEDVVRLAREVVAWAVRDLVPIGARADRRAAFARGEALDWSRLSFAQRQVEMVSVLARHIGGTRLEGLKSEMTVFLTPPRFLGHPVLAWLHAIPAGFGVSAARERIVRPLAREHELADALRRHRAGGPVHFIAVHRTMTESQVASFFGTPDIYVVSGPFGFYAADLTTLQQAFILTQCRDSPAIAHGLTRLTAWLDEVGENAQVVALAKQADRRPSRRRSSRYRRAASTGVRRRS